MPSKRPRSLVGSLATLRGGIKDKKILHRQVESGSCKSSRSLLLSLLSCSDLLETFKTNNVLLDEIQKCLEAYLESKRVIFPRCTSL